MGPHFPLVHRVARTGEGRKQGGGATVGGAVRIATDFKQGTWDPRLWHHNEGHSAQITYFKFKPSIKNPPIPYGGVHKSTNFIAVALISVAMGSPDAPICMLTYREGFPCNPRQGVADEHQTLPLAMVGFESGPGDGVTFLLSTTALAWPAWRDRAPVLSWQLDFIATT